MKTFNQLFPRFLFFLAMVIFFLPEPLQAQRMGHAGGGARMGGGGASRSINGGSRPSANRPPSNSGWNRQSPGSRNMYSGNRQGTNTRTGDMNTGTRNINTDNRTKINNSQNVNINVNRNVAVRVNPRPYPRPPYVYGGFRYSCYHPYVYHPFYPFYWGPMWHPWGFFVTTLAVTAIAVTVASQQYYYDQGMFYVSGNGGYTVVQAPVGATITTLPPGSQTVVINETTNNYYYGGTYYEKTGETYTVVPPTAGTVVEKLPEGGKEVKIGEVTYVQVGETYYQPIVQDGKNMYEVVDVQKGT